MKKILSMLILSNIIMTSTFTDVFAAKLKKSDLPPEILRKVAAKEIPDSVFDYLLDQEFTTEQFYFILDSGISVDSLKILMNHGADQNIIESVIDLKISQENVEYLLEDLGLPLDVFRSLLDLKISNSNIDELVGFELDLNEFRLLTELKISNESIEKLVDLGISISCFKTLLDLRVCDDDLKKILKLNLKLSHLKNFIRLELRPAKLKIILEMNLSREEFIKFTNRMSAVSAKYLNDVNRNYDLNFDDVAYCFIHDLDFRQMKIRNNIIREIRSKAGITLEKKFFDIQEATWRQDNVRMSEDEMRTRIRELAPGSGFDRFVFSRTTEYTSRYDCLSAEQKNQLRLILSLEDEIICNEDCHAKIQAIFSDHENMCSNRLSYIIFEASAVIDELKGIDGESVPANLTKYRNALAEELLCKPYPDYEHLYLGFVQAGYGAENQLKYRSELKNIWAVSMQELSPETYLIISDIVLDKDFIIEVMSDLFSLDSIKKVYIDSIKDNMAFQKALEKKDVSFDDYEKFTKRKQILRKSLEKLSKNNGFNSMSEFLDSALKKELSDKDKKMFEDFKMWYNGEIKLSIEDIVKMMISLLSEMDFENYDEFPEFGEVESYEKNILAEKFIDDLFNNKYMTRCRTVN